MNLVHRVREVRGLPAAPIAVKVASIVRQAGATCGLHVALAVRRVASGCAAVAWQCSKARDAVLKASDGSPRSAGRISQHLFDDRQIETRRLRDEWVKELEDLHQAQRIRARSIAAVPVHATAVSAAASSVAPSAVAPARKRTRQYT